MAYGPLAVLAYKAEQAPPPHWNGPTGGLAYGLNKPRPPTGMELLYSTAK